ncbi:splicing factor 3b subunit 3 [Anaeramoeba ignava]|uniref:Splicing factor 3b subunit 3 n=1 Tax=Anaeramoeba ignava TaxID=1746090 RepID=A0A9Q0LNV0_ANAIG|nr:splicing factor 3b subunit 3 [Anaeramoeba ignava]
MKSEITSINSNSNSNLNSNSNSNSNLIAVSQKTESISLIKWNQTTNQFIVIAHDYFPRMIQNCIFVDDINLFAMDFWGNFFLFSITDSKNNEIQKFSNISKSDINQQLNIVENCVINSRQLRSNLVKNETIDFKGEKIISLYSSSTTGNLICFEIVSLSSYQINILRFLHGILSLNHFTKPLLGNDYESFSSKNYKRKNIFDSDFLFQFFEIPNFEKKKICLKLKEKITKKQRFKINQEEKTEEIFENNLILNKLIKLIEEINQMMKEIK